MTEDDKSRFNEQLSQVTIVAGCGLGFMFLLSAVGGTMIQKFFFNTLPPIYIGSTDVRSFIWAILLVLLFFIIREFATWYWKQNHIIKLLKQIEENTRKESNNDQER